jgi:NTE family protein
VVDNAPLAAVANPEHYSLRGLARSLDRHSGELALVVAFSGGGTRAAALSYGVLQELRDTPVVLNGKRARMLDAVGVISSVSGGSFTSAYYGLYGDRIFVDFEQRFLRRNVEGALIRGLLDPLRWFSSRGRTEMAVAFYQDSLFGNTTFADLARTDGPLILINTSDLGYGVRFSFVQEYFDLLCSDLSTFPVARAVTASSAVPIVFDPVVVENFAGCNSALPGWLSEAQARVQRDANLNMIVREDRSYEQKAAHKYAHFVDGGITDNLGLRALLESVEVVGGAKDYLKSQRVAAPRRIAVLSVNASADSNLGIDATALQPSIETTIDAVTNIQLHRYNVATLQLMQNSLRRWSRELSTPQQPVSGYFISLSFEDVPDEPLRRFLNEIPTSLALGEEQVDRLIDVGRQLLRNNAEYRRLVRDLDGQRGAVATVAPPLN